VPSYAVALDVARASVDACGDRAEQHLRTDLRADRVELAVTTHALGAATQTDVDLARDISTAVERLGLTTGGATSAERARPVQALELAIDTVDAQAIKPFWKAVLAYVDAPGADDAIVDPAGQQPSIWFQDMEPPRLDRNRIHFDITVAHDEADARVRAAIAAGGRLVSEEAARSFWVLADAEGNEICVCTWQDRDEREAAGS
jgi:4a-hydroxytetrahydrobiopterin dehydratase